MKKGFLKILRFIFGVASFFNIVYFIILLSIDKDASVGVACGYLTADEYYKMYYLSGWNISILLIAIIFCAGCAVTCQIYLDDIEEQEPKKLYQGKAILN